MILSEVRNYLRERSQATLSDIALHFDTDADAVRGMMDVLIRKGKIRRRSATNSCGSSCNQCEPIATEIYEWVESTAINVDLPQHCDHK